MTPMTVTPMTMTPMTVSDRAILNLLQKNGRATIEELATASGLSPSSAQRRVQKLRELKVITGDVALVDPKALGFNIAMIVELEVESDRPELAVALHKWIANRPEIQNAWHVTGRSDYILSVVAQSIETFEALIEKLMADNRLVKKYTTSVALKTMKRTMKVPV